MTRYELKPVVSDYGLYENKDLILICSSRKNALLIKAILEKDYKFQSGVNGNPEFTAEDFHSFQMRNDSRKKVRTSEQKRG